MFNMSGLAGLWHRPFWQYTGSNMQGMPYNMNLGQFVNAFMPALRYGMPMQRQFMPEFRPPAYQGNADRENGYIGYNPNLKNELTPAFQEVIGGNTGYNIYSGGRPRINPTLGMIFKARQGMI